MALGRRVDRQAINLTRQGALGVYASSLGQEAAQVGAAFALEQDDWLFPTYRDTVGVFALARVVPTVVAALLGAGVTMSNAYLVGGRRYSIQAITEAGDQRSRQPATSRRKRVRISLP